MNTNYTNRTNQSVQWTFSRHSCQHSHSSPEGISGRPPLLYRPRLSRCRDSRPSRPSLGSQELSLLRCQGMAEGNRLPSLDNAPNLKTDGSFLKPTFNRWYLLWITWIDETYWVIGATLGSLIGPFLNFDLKGLDFTLCLPPCLQLSSPTTGFGRKTIPAVFPD